MTHDAANYMGADISCQAHFSTRLVPLLSLLERDIHDTVASQCGCVHGFYTGVNISLQHRPLCIANGYDCNSASREVLLVRDVLIRRQQKLKTSAFSHGEQITIRQAIPTLLGCGPDGMLTEKRPDGDRCPLIKLGYSFNVRTPVSQDCGPRIR
jgi:hypothetical protein